LGATAALGAVFAATFEAVAFEPVAFAAVFAVLSGIELLLFFEDFVAAAFFASFTDALARPLVALRLAAAAFFEVFETLFLRVFCDTACARNCHAPVDVFTGPPGAKNAHHGYAWPNPACNVPNIAHFPQKSMIYAPFRTFAGTFGS
jgi:hypothetical protein